MKKNDNTMVEKLIIAIGIPLLIGSLSGFLSGNSRLAFQQLEQPSLAPPGWLFPIVWTILFLLMGVASYLIYQAERVDSQRKQRALFLYALQLFVNFFWSLIFFVGEWYLLAFLWLVLLWILIVLTIRAFYTVSKPAAYLMIPYLAWVTFAGYLNLMIFFLN